MEWNLMAVAAVRCLIQQIPVHLKRHMDEKNTSYATFAHGFAGTAEGAESELREYERKMR